MKEVSKKSKAGELLALVISGAGIGWLMGQSVSPVLMTVVTGLIAVVGSVISALSGLKGEEVEEGNVTSRRFVSRATALPLGAFVLGLAGGAPVGLHARTHQWFASSAQDTVEAWDEMGIPREEVTRRLFEQQFPASPPERFRQWIGKDAEHLVKQWSSLKIPPERVAGALFRLQFPDNPTMWSGVSQEGKAEQSSVLFSEKVEKSCPMRVDCSGFKIANDKELLRLMGAGRPKMRALVSEVNDPKLLRKLAEAMCEEDDL